MPLKFSLQLHRVDPHKPEHKGFKELHPYLPSHFVNTHKHKLKGTAVA